MSRIGAAGSAAGSALEGAAGGGRCGQQNGLNDVMPELLRTDAQGAVVLLNVPGVDFGVDFTNLRSLMHEQQQAMSEGPGVFDRVKNMIVTQFLVPDVKADAREILGPMFAIPEEGITPDRRNQLIDCILNSLIEDLSVFRSIQMTGTLLLKAFYKNNVFRVAIAASFVGSVAYVGWISGLGNLCELTLDGCRIVFSALAACHHLIANPDEFMAQFNLLLGEPISGQIAYFITVLRENIATPALFAGLVAQGNVTLLERLYRQPAVPAPDAERGQPAQAQEPGHLENLREAIDREIARLEAERAGAPGAGAAGAGAAGAGAPGAGAAGDHLQALLVARESINRAIAPDPAADAAAAAQGPAPAAAAAAVPAPAAPAAAAAANRSLFNVMLTELRAAGGVISRYVQRYVLNLYNYLNRVRQIFPGVVGANGTDFLSYSCNVFLQNRIISLFGIISAQFTNAGTSERQTLLSTLLEYI